MLDSDVADDGAPRRSTAEVQQVRSIDSARRKTPQQNLAVATRARHGRFSDRVVPIHVSHEEDYATLLRFLQLAPIGLVETNLDGDIQIANPLSLQLLEPLTGGKRIDNLFEALQTVAPDLRERAASFPTLTGFICDKFQMLLEQGVQARHDATVLSLTLIRLDEDHLMAVLDDISTAVQRERDLRESQAWVNTMVTGISDYATVLLDKDGRIQSWNPTIERVTGFREADVQGQGYDMFYAADAITPHTSNDRLQDADLHGWALDEGWRPRADGSEYWGSCLIAPLAASDPADPSHGYSLIVRDISERKEVNEALRRSVSYDHLTGLSNRRAFLEAAESELERWERTHSDLSLMMIDADHFKRVNDTHGHHAGDAVLRHLAAGIAAASRAMDVVARLGGEEFVILLPSTTPEGAEVVATRLLKSIAAQQVIVDGKRIRYTVSAGVATMQPGWKGIDELLKRADAALYHAKRSGRNRVERWAPDLPVVS